MYFFHYLLQTVMKMYIPRVLRHHFGTYACKAKNPRGDTDGIITLSGKKFLGYARLLEVQPLNTSYLTDSYIGFTLKMESLSKNKIFGLTMMVKSGLEKNILKFHVPLQRYLLTCQANSAFLGRFFCTGQQQL